MNLYNETLKVLNKYGKKKQDIKQVIIRGKMIFPLKDFWESIRYLNYDSGYGRCEIEDSLKLVGDSFWLERDSYDGSEWWEFKKFPVVLKGEITKDVSVLFEGGLNDLGRLNYERDVKRKIINDED